MNKVASLRLTVLLLLLLAIAAAMVTHIPQGQEPALYTQRYGEQSRWILGWGLHRFYQGPVFRALLSLLFINLLACGLRRSLAALTHLRARGRPSAHLPLGDRSTAVRVLRQRGFRVTSNVPLCAHRMRWAFLGFPLVHLSPVLIAVGALWGSWGGYVGTTYGVPHQPTWTCFDWSSQVDRELPFVLVVDDIRVLNYPLKLRVQVGPDDSGGNRIETREGGAFKPEGSPYTVRVGELDLARRELRYWLLGEKGTLGPFSSRQPDAPLHVQPLQYADPVVKRVEVDLTRRSAENRVLERHTLAVNEPVVADGVRIYLTAWSHDLANEPWVGLQVVRDPGQVPVWIGSLGMMLGISCLLFFRGTWLREEGDCLVGHGPSGLLRGLREELAPQGDRAADADSEGHAGA